MSVTVEWYDATHTQTGAVQRGEEVGEHAVTKPYAITIAADSVAVIEGDYIQLRQLLKDAQEQLQALDWQNASF